MRIVGGRWRGLGLAALGRGDAAAHLRPTSDRVRESLFSILTAGAFGDRVTGARVLDLFAGTGALGLEALSRGAAEATFVDDGRRALALIRANLDKAGAAGRVLARDATRLPANSGPPFDLVFLDPPYGKGLGERALAAATAGRWIASGALVAWEESDARDVPAGFEPLDRRRWGQTTVTFLQAPPWESASPS